MLFCERKDRKIHCEFCLKHRLFEKMSSASASSADKVRKPKESLASLKVKESEYSEEVVKYQSQFGHLGYIQILEKAKKEEKEERVALRKYADATINHSIVSEKINKIEKKREIDQVEKQEKRDLTLTKKNMRKGIYSESILTEMVARCPPEIISIIGQYLTVECMNNLLSFDLYRKIHNIGVADMIRGFLCSIRNNPQYLTIISREEARAHFRVIRGVQQPNENIVSYLCFLDFNSICKVKTNIYDIIVMAKVGNPLFANKMLKTIAVLNKNKKLLKRNFIDRNMPELTEFDLPAIYL